MNDNEVNNPLPDDVEALIDEIEVYGVFGIFWAAMQPLAFSWLIPTVALEPIQKWQGKPFRHSIGVSTQARR